MRPSKSFIYLILAVIVSACGLSPFKMKNNQNSNATLENSTDVLTSTANTTGVPSEYIGTLVYDGDGNTINYKGSAKDQSCKATDCTPDLYSEACTDAGFKSLSYGCCGSVCTGKIDIEKGIAEVKEKNAKEQKANACDKAKSDINSILSTGRRCSNTADCTALTPAIDCGFGCSIGVNKIFAAHKPQGLIDSLASFSENCSPSACDCNMNGYVIACVGGACNYQKQ